MKKIEKFKGIPNNATATAIRLLHGKGLVVKLLWMKLILNQSVTMFDEVHDTAIREYLKIKSLLLRIKRSQPVWLSHVSRMPPK